VTKKELEIKAIELQGVIFAFRQDIIHALNVLDKLYAEIRKLPDEADK